MHEINIFKLIDRISILLRSEERKKYALIGLQPVHGQVLEYLARCNQHSNTPAALTEYLGLTKGTVSQTLQVLVRKNYIEKQADKNDRRIVHLLLTASGRELHENLKPLGVFLQAEQQISICQFDTIGHALNQTLIALQRANHCRSFGICKTCRYFTEQYNHYQCELSQTALTQADTEKICRDHIPV